MLIRVERKWIDKPFAEKRTSLILIEGKVNKSNALNIAISKLVAFEEIPSVEYKLSDKSRFCYVDKEGFRIIADIYLEGPIEKHLDALLNIRKVLVYEERALFYMDGYKKALESEGYDVERLEGMVDAYDKLKSSR